MTKISKALALTAVVAGAALAVAVAAPHHGPTETVIDDAQDKRAAVEFQHQKHIELVASCDTCHHVNEGLTAETDKDVQSCSACHLDPEGDVPGMRQMSLSKNPFHMVCIDCHKAEKAGPTKCDDCHPKG